jgi:hypothetical protein
MRGDELGLLLITSSLLSLLPSQWGEFPLLLTRSLCARCCSLILDALCRMVFLELSRFLFVLRLLLWPRRLSDSALAISLAAWTCATRIIMTSAAGTSTTHTRPTTATGQKAE